jgi:glycosyltransferase involved in cell wall biosynthesis
MASLTSLEPRPSATPVAPADKPFSVVCLSTAGFDVPLPTNRQQVMRRLAGRGHEVLFVETGAFLGRHVARLARRGDRSSLVRELVWARDAAPRIRTRKALNLLPRGHTYAAANAVNTALTKLALRGLVRRLPQPVVLWLYDPCAVGVAGIGEAFVVYDCVDDFSSLEFYGPRERALVAAADERAARTARVVFATTSTLYERHTRSNPETHLVRNVGDFEHFVPAADPSFAAPELLGLDRPVIGFAGNFMPGKVDFDALEAVARRSDWTLLLVGPAEAAVSDELERVTRHENVLWLGAKPYAELPRYVAAFDVALIPYVTNGYTASCFPLKTFEYLAAGKPVVATGLPELAGMEPDVVLADGPAGLVEAIESALDERSDDDRSRRMALAAQNTWETRVGRLVELVARQLPG